MTKGQMTKAIQGHDEVGMLLDEMRKAVASGDDAMLNLIERMTAATRADTVSDVLVDLKSDGQHDAYSLVKSNY